METSQLLWDGRGEDYRGNQGAPNAEAYGQAETYV